MLKFYPKKSKPISNGWNCIFIVAVEMQTMVSCEYTAAASRGWSAFDWAEHCLKQERGIKDDDICVSYVWRQWQFG